MPSNLHKPPVKMLGFDARQWSMMYGDRLSDRFFFVTLGVALLVHLAGIGAWWMAPKTRVIDVPVRALNVKLGGDESINEEELKASPTMDNKKAVENTISRLVRDEKPEARKKPIENKAEKKIIVPPPTAKTDAAPRQFVRSNPQDSSTPKMASTGEKLDEKGSKELLSRYEQLISMWIQKFKQYPEEARRQGMRGETMVRIRIDRRGNIHYWALENSTGHDLLDRAAIDMVKRANPVPAVPNNYPAGEQFDFLIPVNFRLE